jgi:hypothetical protein
MKLRLAPLKRLDLDAFPLSDLKTIGIPDVTSANVWDLRKIGIRKIDLNDKIAPGATDLTGEQRERNRLDLRAVEKGSATIGDAVEEVLRKNRREDTSSGTGGAGSRPPTVSGEHSGQDGPPADSPFRAAPPDIPVQHSATPVGTSFLHTGPDNPSENAAAQTGPPPAQSTNTGDNGPRGTATGPASRSSTAISHGGSRPPSLTNFLGGRPPTTSPEDGPGAASAVSSSDSDSTVRSDWPSESGPESEATTPGTGSRPGAPHLLKQATTLVPGQGRAGQGRASSASPTS